MKTKTTQLSKQALNQNKKKVVVIQGNKFKKNAWKNYYLPETEQNK